jgi:predicted metal-dependent hydrolase
MKMKWTDEANAAAIKRLKCELAKARDALQRRADELNVLQGSIAAYQSGNIEAALATAREALACAEDLARDYAWTRQKDIDFKPDLDNDAHFSGYANDHAVMKFRRARAALAENERLKEAKDNLHWNLRTERDATKAAEAALAKAREYLETIWRAPDVSSDIDDAGFQRRAKHDLQELARAALTALPKAPEVK